MGNVIYDMMQQTGQDAPHIAMEIFGVKTSMAYRCLYGEQEIHRRNGCYQARKTNRL